VVLGAASLLAGDGFRMPSDVPTWGAVAYLAIAGSVVTFLVYFRLLEIWCVTSPRSRRFPREGRYRAPPRIFPVEVAIQEDRAPVNGPRQRAAPSAKARWLPDFDGKAKTT
jgi:hypothetical protein